MLAGDVASVKFTGAKCAQIALAGELWGHLASGGCCGVHSNRGGVLPRKLPGCIQVRWGSLHTVGSAACRHPGTKSSHKRTTPPAQQADDFIQGHASAWSRLQHPSKLAVQCTTTRTSPARMSIGNAHHCAGRPAGLRHEGARLPGGGHSIQYPVRRQSGGPAAAAGADCKRVADKVALRCMVACSQLCCIGPAHAGPARTGGPHARRWAAAAVGTASPWLGRRRSRPRGCCRGLTSCSARPAAASPPPLPCRRWH
jgi:hypothetical protein